MLDFKWTLIFKDFPMLRGPRPSPGQQQRSPARDAGGGHAAAPALRGGGELGRRAPLWQNVRSHTIYTVYMVPWRVSPPPPPNGMVLKPRF